MNAVQTDKLKPGQVLAEEVRDINGRLLLASGKEIQSSHIRIFKIWGITEVQVAGATRQKDKFDSKLDPELVELARESMTILCRHVDLEHPAIKEIYNLAVQFRCRNDLVEVESNLHITEPEQPHQTQEENIIDELNKRKIILPAELSKSALFSNFQSQIIIPFFPGKILFFISVSGFNFFAI